MKTILYLALFASIIYTIYRYKRETILKYIARVGYYIKVYVKKRNKVQQKVAEMSNPLPAPPEKDLGVELIDRIAELKCEHYKKYGSTPSVVFMGENEYATLRKSPSLRYTSLHSFDVKDPIKYDGKVFGMKIRVLGVLDNCLEVGDEGDFARFLRDTQGLN